MNFPFPLLQQFVHRRSIAVLVVICQIFNSGCIHTADHETKNIELPQTQEDLSVKNFGNVEIRSAIYLPSKLPLSDFFSRVRRGELSEAFKKMDLNYRPSHSQNKALEDIVESGFIPVYVEIKNQGDESLSFDEKNFTIIDHQREIKAFYSESLPREFKKFSTSAAAANVVNTGIVIVGFAAVLFAMIFIEKNSSGGDPHLPNTGGSSPQIYNSTIKTTHVDYKNYLLSAATLKPGESKKGLLFFYWGQEVGIENPHLIYTSKP